MTLETTINNHTFVLHCSGAMYWVEKRMLLISDVHLGKISHFRKFGSALPGNAIFQNFIKLDNTVEYFNPESICFLGDLFHSTLNNEWNLFTEWVERTQLPIILVAGNHDIIEPHKYEELGITVVSEWTLDGFLLIHDPQEREDYYTLSGHIHPAVLLAGKGRQFLKLPCFFRTPNQLILPAFGEFTGTYVMEPQEDDKVYVITKEDVVEVARKDRR
ncbi:ligase-associated DNA damage response endonuclease PdeM [Flavobacterium sp. DG1-102-2]|uniref:ligase-associated DNA damage response endonuclease PdeM n=1 Tax=Flavobacterium sp. DG1-102-2 TaxID=3081663 RepID=UPI002949259C|nr:ligase-associated DNA damage response endonuclease PdeM [Flavobacterium sp. DG1-102-2]MDV6167605.1 ligase-associated DNA damage response endonuclease PdeM [Flavobacterium sp. DG1-102-2]